MVSGYVDMVLKGLQIDDRGNLLAVRNHHCEASETNETPNQQFLDGDEHFSLFFCSFCQINMT